MANDKDRKRTKPRSKREEFFDDIAAITFFAALVAAGALGTWWAY